MFSESVLKEIKAFKDNYTQEMAYTTCCSRKESYGSYLLIHNWLWNNNK